jgi:hypothetical protein
MDQNAEIELQTANWPEDSAGRLPYPMVKVTPLDDPEWEQPYGLTGISLSDIQLVANESPHLNELICVELSDHLILADVKRSVRRGQEFVTDAARIVTIPKTPDLEKATSLAKMEALLADFRLQCKTQLLTIEASIGDLDTRMGGGIPNIAPRPGSFLERNLGPPEPDVKVQQPQVPLPVIGPAQINEQYFDSLLEPLDPPAPAERVPRFAIERRRASFRPWVISIGIAAGLAFLLGGIPSYLPLRMAKVSTLNLPAPPKPPPPPLAPPALNPAKNLTARMHVSITATAMSWISVCSDGKERFSNVIRPGDNREIDFARRAVVRLGNSPAVAIKVEGKPIEPLGVPRVVQAIELSPTGSRYLASSPHGGACTDSQGLIPTVTEPPTGK